MNMSFSNAQLDNTVIASMGDMAIVKDDRGSLYICEMPEEFIEIGEIMPFEDLTPLDEMPTSTIEKVLAIVEEAEG